MALFIIYRLYNILFNVILSMLRYCFRIIESRCHNFYLLQDEAVFVRLANYWIKNNVKIIWHNNTKVSSKIYPHSNIPAVKL